MINTLNIRTLNAQETYLLNTLSVAGVRDVMDPWLQELYDQCS